MAYELTSEDRQRLADGLFLQLARNYEKKEQRNLSPEEKADAEEEYEKTILLFQEIVKGVSCPCCGEIVPAE